MLSENNLLSWSGALAVFFCLFVCAAPAMGQAAEREISGTVRASDTGETLPGVNVSVPGTDTGTSTGPEGTYRLTVTPEADSLSFSFVGYETQTVAIAGRSEIDVTLSLRAVQGEEVIVTALGIEREERSLGYATQEVEAAEITDAPDVSPVNALQGKLAGVQISQAASGMGGSSRVVIRGSRFLSDDNEPLYVVDGVPINGSDDLRSGAFGGVDYGGDLNSINPDDIASTTVLRGANAAALYGERAANGAVLIETKEGTERTSVTFNSTLTFDRPLVLPDLQNEYGRGSQGTVCGEEDCTGEEGVPAVNTESDMSWGPRMEGQPVRNWTGAVQPFSPQPDNVSDFFETGYSSSNSLSFSTGSDAATAHFSLSNLQGGNLLPGGQLDRTNLSLRASTNLTDRLEVEGRATYLKERAENRPYLTQNPDNAIFNFYYMPRNIRLNNIENYATEGTVPEPRIWMTGDLSRRQNPYWSVNLNTNEDNENRLFGFLRIGYDFTDWLNVFLRGGTDYSQRRREQRFAKNTTYKPGGTGEYQLTKSEVQETNVDLVAEMDGDLTEDVSGRLTAGTSYRYRRGETDGYRGREFSVPNLFTISNFNTQTPLYDFSEKQVASAYGQGQIGFRGYLFLDATARADWSSTLPEENIPYFYPSVSTSFIFSDVIDVPGLRFGKVRASVASVGNDTDPYQLGLEYTLGVSHADRTTGSVPILLPNDDLEPQRTRSYEAGTDLRFFEGERLRLTATVYRTQTFNQIIPIETSDASGYRRRIVNAGQIDNRGLELLASGTPIAAEDEGGFSWNVSANWTTSTTEVADLADNVPVYSFGTEFGLSVIAEEGRPLGDIVGAAYERNENGRRVISGETGLPVQASRDTLLGNFQPDWKGGLTNTFSFKGFSLEALVSFQKGGDLFSLSNAVASAQGTLASTLEGREAWYSGNGGYVAEGVVNTGTAEDPVWEENTRAVDPQAYWNDVGGLNAVAEEFVYDASYVKLREVVLAYQLPSSLLGTLPVRSARVSVFGRNLALLHKNTPGFDPSAANFTNSINRGREAFAFPSTRSIGAGLKVQF